VEGPEAPVVPVALSEGLVAVQGGVGQLVRAQEAVELRLQPEAVAGAQAVLRVEVLGEAVRELPRAQRAAEGLLAERRQPPVDLLGQRVRGVERLLAVRRLEQLLRAVRRAQVFLAASSRR
jgi:hypothetical protein